MWCAISQGFAWASRKFSFLENQLVKIDQTKTRVLKWKHTCVLVESLLMINIVHVCVFGSSAVLAWSSIKRFKLPWNFHVVEFWCLSRSCFVLYGKMDAAERIRVQTLAVNSYTYVCTCRLCIVRNMSRYEHCTRSQKTNPAVSRVGVLFFRILEKKCGVSRRFIRFQTVLGSLERLKFALVSMRKN